MTLQDKTMADLNMRKALVQKILEEFEAKGDPRVEEPRRQLSIIQAEIDRRNKPKNQTIGLDVLNLTAKKD